MPPKLPPCGLLKRGRGRDPPVHHRPLGKWTGFFGCRDHTCPGSLEASQTMVFLKRVSDIIGASVRFGKGKFHFVAAGCR